MIASAGRPIPATGPGAGTTAQAKTGSIKATATMPTAAKPVTFQTLMVASLAQKHATKVKCPIFTNTTQAKLYTFYGGCSNGPS
jgi:hypothetical protein